MPPSLAIDLNLITTWCGFVDQKEYALRAQRICHYPASSLLPEFSSMTLRALLYRRPTEPQAIEVVCDGAVHLVRLRRHRQARRYTLRVVAVTREAILTMPPRGSFREAREFAERHGAWIAARLDRLPRRSEEHTSELQSRLHLVCRLLLEK